MQNHHTIQVQGLHKRFGEIQAVRGSLLPGEFPGADGFMISNIQLENRLGAQTTRCAMGTVMTHKAFGLYAEDSLAAVCREVARIEGLLITITPRLDCI